MFTVGAHDRNQREHRQGQHLQHFFFTSETGITILEPPDEEQAEHESRRCAGGYSAEALKLVVRFLRKRRDVQELELFANLAPLQVGGDHGIFTFRQKIDIRGL